MCSILVHFCSIKSRRSNSMQAKYELKSPQFLVEEFVKLLDSREDLKQIKDNQEKLKAIEKLRDEFLDANKLHPEFDKIKELLSQQIYNFGQAVQGYQPAFFQASVTTLQNGLQQLSTSELAQLFAALPRSIKTLDLSSIPEDVDPEEVDSEQHTPKFI